MRFTAVIGPGRPIAHTHTKRHHIHARAHTFTRTHNKHPIMISKYSIMISIHAILEFYPAHTEDIKVLD